MPPTWSQPNGSTTTADDAVLDRVVELPWSARPGRAIMAIYLNEVTVHTWDLARATGQDPVWDDVVVGMALDAVQVLTGGGRLPAFDAVGTTIAPDWDRSPEPSGGRPIDPVDVPFAHPLDVDAAAPLIDRLVAWNGRQP